MSRSTCSIIVVLLVGSASGLAALERWDPARDPLRIPRLAAPPVIDGDLSEWKGLAFSDGLWDIFRIRQTPWYNPDVNRLTDHGGEPSAEDDLQARYYTAWDETNFYFGAEVKDNVNDIQDPNHEPKRWYFKDAVCWFIEAPADARADKFGLADHTFCFVIDPAKPPYGAWWTHGSAKKTFIEEPIPREAVDYAIRMNPWKRSPADFILEARVAMAPTLGRGDPRWHAPRVGDVYRLEIVHTDPDGGDYGGHIILYGDGGNPATWGHMILAGPTSPIERKTN
jgi:hypothetical protein